MKKWKLNEYLFMYRGWYWYRNLKDIPIMIKRIFFCLKHGYMPQAQWETFSFMTDMMEEIISRYRNDRFGTQWVLNSEHILEREEENSLAFNKMCDEMLEQLKEMKTWDDISLTDNNEYKKKTLYLESVAKKFWTTFGKHYFGWWD